MIVFTRESLLYAKYKSGRRVQVDVTILFESTELFASMLVIRISSVQLGCYARTVKLSCYNRYKNLKIE